MKSVFLIHTHKDPEQVARLVGLLRRGCANAFVLISHDARSAPLSGPAFTGADVHVLRGAGGRGDFTILDGYLAALRWLRSENLRYDWVTSLSGQDFPIAPLSGFDGLLDSTPFDGFLHHFDALRQEASAMGGWDWPEGHGAARYLYRYRRYRPTLGRLERAVLRLPRLALDRFSARYRINATYGLMVGRRASATPFDAGRTCYAGSYWNTIRADCAAFLLDFTDANRDFVEYYRSVLIPDESFIQTILVNDRRFRFHNDNLRYMDFRASHHGHPKILGIADLAEMSASTAYFARKFAWPVSPPLLDRLEERALSASAPVR